MKIAFAGTPEFARAALEALLAAGHHVGLVLTQPDRPSGRGLKTIPSPVKACALQHGISVAQPRSLRSAGRYPEEARVATEQLRECAPELMVVAAYGLILPPATLVLPRHGCINIHASLLPRWRGAAPIERAIEAGDSQTGVTIMQMEEGLDTGPMLLTRALPIGPSETAATLRLRLQELGAALIVEALEKLAAGTLEAVPQPATGANYAPKLAKEEAPLAFDRDAQALSRRIRAFDPQPGSTARAAGEVLKIWSARAEPGAGVAPPGTIVGADAQGIRVACNPGILCITELQRAGGRRLSVREFLQGFALAPGMLLS